MAVYLVQKRNIGCKLGKQWLTRFLDCYPDLTSKFSMRLKWQRTYIKNLVIIHDCFKKIRLAAIIANSGQSFHFCSYVKWF